MTASTKDLFKILVGAAWLDGKIQPEEQAYLQRIAVQKGLSEDPELQLWVNGSKSISSEDCFRWVSEYLGQNPAPEDGQQLLEELSGLIYSDSEVDSKEAELLMHFQQVEEAGASRAASPESVINAIKTLYKRWIKD